MIEAVSFGSPEARFETTHAIAELKKHATRLSKKTKVGRKPFGKGPGESQILERIWELRRKRRDGTGRLSYGAIAEILNSEGLKTRQGKTWYSRTVQGIVKRTKPHLDKDEDEPFRHH